MKTPERLSSATLVLLLTLVACGPGNPGAGEEAGQFLTICSYGGAFQDAQRKAFFEPFMAETGIEIREASYGGEYARLKLMVDNEQVEWDLVDVESDMLLRGAQENLFEPIDYSIVKKSVLLADATHRYGVATDFFSTALSFRPGAFPEGRAPRDWADFWNTDGFKGARALRRDPRSTLEFALLADGVEASELYPLDVDRAFASLDRIRDSVRVWWSTGHQPSELLASKEVAMASSFSARIWVAATLEGKPLAFSWEQALIDPEWWVIPRGSEKVKLAHRFIAFASQAERQAEFSKNIGLGPTNPQAFDFMDSALKSQLNTFPENLGKQILVDAAWWAENYPQVLDRWVAWQAGAEPDGGSNP